jgi:hypothetical protein
MDFELIDHIGIYKNAMATQFCEEYIEFFNELDADKGSWYNKEVCYGLSAMSFGDDQFKEHKLGRSDTSIFVNFVHKPLASVCYDVLQNCFEHYSSIYPGLKDDKLSTFEIKLQKTEPGGGYHIWHNEKSGYMNSSRQLAWMIYLNDMPDGEAETEFFYQKLRITPEAGTVVLWPSSYTHTHRGNTVYTKNKYILTGWFSSLPD